MAEPLTKTQRKQILESFSEWSLDDGISFSRDAIRTVRGETEFTLDGFLDELRRYIANDGDVRQLTETREGYRQRGMKYEVRCLFGTQNVFLYFYLDDSSRLAPPMIFIANVHCND